MGAEILYVMLFTLWLAGDEQAPYAVWRDQQLMTFQQCDMVTDELLPIMLKAAKKKYPKTRLEIKVNCVQAGVIL